MDKQTFDRIVDAFEQAEFEPRSYSGRGMYGKECLGVTCRSPAGMMAQLFAALAENAEDLDEVKDLAEALSSPSSDSMGYDAIVYWPGIPWLGDADGESGVEVREDEFVDSHGRRPRGEGSWFFFPDGADDVKDAWHFSGDYKDVRRQAVEKAVEQGVGSLTVGS